MAQFSAFQLDKKSVKEFKKFLEEAAALPRKRISHAAKEGAKVAMSESERILRASQDNFKMAFKDGNTWSKDDIIKNLTVKLEKGKRKQKRVAQIGIKDSKVSLYSNFPEFGYTTINGVFHEGTHFMRDGLTNTRNEVEEVMIEDLRKSLDKLRSD